MARLSLLIPDESKGELTRCHSRRTVPLATSVMRYSKRQTALRFVRSSRQSHVKMVSKDLSVGTRVKKACGRRSSRYQTSFAKTSGASQPPAR